ncbi:rap guanine nucleotide exchange factor 5-like [Athene cunicularia]|uniref:rap guanine nucleotide exchange factor 5-like n=1 Tax=Athene cunicularia TaxID=194338 RepID=UPI000EF72683|nr:rap guanine nucleotide exchange factor 5-like [Athene cunicularia]
MYGALLMLLRLQCWQRQKYQQLLEQLGQEAKHKQLVGKSSSEVEMRPKQNPRSKNEEKIQMFLQKTLSRRISNPYLETPSNKIYGESSSCAGRALRNIFTLQASDLIKDRVYLTGICRRSCVGSELVDWLLEQCPFVKCRSTAVGVWQLLLDMGIILSVDRQLYFQDTHAFYQFSADECTYLFCEFEKEEGWKNGVKLLLQLLPLSPPRIDMCNLPDQKMEDTAETNAEILARLTSAVQRELAAVIALKARKSAIHQNEENSSQEIRGLEELKDTSDAQAGVLCKLQGRDDIGRIELVQKLARENRQFLQADRKPPEKAEQWCRSSHSFIHYITTLFSWN